MHAALQPNVLKCKISDFLPNRASFGVMSLIVGHRFLMRAAVTMASVQNFLVISLPEANIGPSLPKYDSFVQQFYFVVVGTPPTVVS